MEQSYCTLWQYQVVLIRLWKSGQLTFLLALLLKIYSKENSNQVFLEVCQIFQVL